MGGIGAKAALAAFMLLVSLSYGAADSAESAGSGVSSESSAQSVIVLPSACERELLVRSQNETFWRAALFGNSAKIYSHLYRVATRLRRDVRSPEIEVMDHFPTLSYAEIQAVMKDPEALTLMQHVVLALVAHGRGWSSLLIDWAKPFVHFPFQKEEVGKELQAIAKIGTIAYRAVQADQVDRLEELYEASYELGENELAQINDPSATLANKKRARAAFVDARTESNTILLLLAAIGMEEPSDRVVRPQALRVITEASRRDNQAKLISSRLHLKEIVENEKPLFEGGTFEGVSDWTPDSDSDRDAEDLD